MDICNLLFVCLLIIYICRKWVGSVDLNPNEEADFSVCVPREETLVNQEKHILETIEKELNGQKLDAVFCVAGGWAGGNATKCILYYAI